MERIKGPGLQLTLASLIVERAEQPNSRIRKIFGVETSWKLFGVEQRRRRLWRRLRMMERQLLRWRSQNEVN